MEKKSEIVIIAAVAEKNRVIGKELDLPWRIPEDLKRFKRLTTGHPLLMGRRTFESLVHQFGGPLRDRRNVVLTSTEDFDGYPGVETYRSTDEALQACVGEEVVFIGGGASIYAYFLPAADRLELTLVEGDYEGDTFFPPYEHLIGPVFELTAEEPRDGYRFSTFRRKE
jgi:dihydrofolate reductase